MLSAKQRGLQWLRPLTVLVLASSSLAAISQLADAQIVPDATLEAERSRLTSLGARERIEGGAIRGSSLFHSFSEFNVNGGQQVYFANPAAITNILTRVTGRNPSNILGTLGVEGGANLFLINPNGIVFGPNARLDVAGSFTATTADSIWLDRYEFSATNPQAPPLLAINITPGLQYGSNAPDRVIENQGSLAVGMGQNLSLLGGTVSNSGSLITPGGNIFLSALGNITTGSLDSQTATGRGGDITVSSSGGGITTTQALSTDSTTQAGNISLTAAGDINVTRSITANSLGQAGNLTLTAGGDLNLTSNGFIRGGTSAFGTTGNIASVGARSGTITLTSGGTLSGQDVRVANVVTGSSPGKETSITARSILLKRSSILALTNSSGRSGDMQVNVAEDVVLQDSNIATNANDGTSGDAGDLALNTQHLSIIRTPGIVLPFVGVGVGTSTDPGSSGNSGNLVINASESVELRGDLPGAFLINPTQVVADLGRTARTAINTIASGSGNSGNLTIHTKHLVTQNGAGIFTFPLVGRGGDLTINATEIRLQGAGGISTGTVGLQQAGNLAIAADRITLTDGALITAATAGSGNAGDLTLSVRQLNVLSGSAVSTVTLGGGNGGVATIHNAELIEVAGTSPNGEFPSRIKADSWVTGNAGRLDITADRLSIRQGGGITVSGTGTGNAGNIGIDARSLLLDRGFITATSASREGGNITLRIADLQLLRRGSTISTTAGQAQTGGNGGNINIQAGFIVAVTSENSDITANAFEGRGGNITLATQGLFGPQFRDRLTPLSDITASSEVGLDGIVTIDVLNPDPARSLFELPVALVDPTGQIVARCSAPTNQPNSFVVTGRGGLPQDPRQFLPGQAVIQDLRLTVGDAIVETPQTISATPQNDSPSPTPHSPPIIEAQGWRVNAQGDVELVATLPQAQQAIAHLNCQTLKQGDRR